MSQSRSVFDHHPPHQISTRGFLTGRQHEVMLEYRPNPFVFEVRVHSGKGTLRALR